MNIKWNAGESRFEADFSSDFQGDLEAVKLAKFHTTGPPSWIWYAPGIKALNRLRKKRPASGLTITPEALAVYTPLAAQEEANEVVKKQLLEARKKLKKEGVQNAPEHPEYYFTSEWYESWRDDKAAPQPKSCHVFPFPIPPPPDLKCLYCHQPVYFYEQQDPPICLWCQKLEDDDFEDFLK